MKLISIETQIMKATIALLLTRGKISVNDGEETTVKRSTNPVTILAAMRTTDEDYLIIHRDDMDETGDAWVRFIYGNGETDVINDYTVNLESIMAKITVLIDEYEAR